MIATLVPLRTLAGRIALAAAVLALGLMLGVGVLSHIALSRKLKLRATDDVAAKRVLLQHILSEVPPTAALTHGRHRLDDLLNGRRHLHRSSHIVGGSRPTALGLQPRDTYLAQNWASCPNYARKKR